MRRTVLLTSLLALSAVGCPNIPPQTKLIGPQDYYFAATPERVWNALLLVYTDLNMPISNMDKASWFIRSQHMISRSDTAWVDCGTDALHQPLAGTVSLSMAVTSLLRPSGDSTAMRLNVNLEPTGNAQGPVECVSKGALEQHVVELVRHRL